MPYLKEKRFGLLFAAVFAIAAVWPMWPPHAPNPYWLAGAGVWLATALIRPKILAPLYKTWMVLGHALGWINARVVLGIVFFVVVTPIGLVMRIFGKDVLRLRTHRADSYWIRRDRNLNPESMRNQF